jgi:hypothetical protein
LIRQTTGRERIAQLKPSLKKQTGRFDKRPAVIDCSDCVYCLSLLLGAGQFGLPAVLCPLDQTEVALFMQRMIRSSKQKRITRQKICESAGFHALAKG